MGTVIAIIFLVLILWFMDKGNRDSDMPKTDPKSQIKQLKNDLYLEINRLNKRIDFLEARLRGEKVEESEFKTDVSASSADEFLQQEPLKEQELPQGQELSQEQESEIQEQTNIAQAQEEAKQETIFESILADKQEKPTPDEVVIDKKKTKNEFESYLAADLFNKIGAVALILGVGFFLKYAFDNNLFAPIIQILLSALFGVGLIWASVHFYKQQKYKIFAQGISGAGIAILYLTVYSGYSNYHLFNYPIAGILMLFTTIIAFYQSVKYDSMATAILALIGGFVTPFILSIENSNAVGLLTYLVFLNGLVVALLRQKESWKIIGILSLLTTYLTYAVMHFNSYGLDSVSSIIFLMSIWLLYFVFDIIKIKDSVYDYNPLNILNIILFYVSVYNLYYSDKNSLISTTFLISLTYLFSAIAVYELRKKPENYLKQNFHIFAILLVITTYLVSSGFQAAMMFSLEAFVLVYFGTRFEKSYIKNFSTIFFTISYLMLLCNPQIYYMASVENFVPLFNFRDLTFALVIGLTVLGIKQLEQSKNLDEVNGLVSFYNFSWATLLFVFLGIEVNDVMLKLASYTSSQESRDLMLLNKAMSHVIVWSLYSARLLFVGMEKKIKPFAVIGSIGSVIAVYLLIGHGSTFTPIARFIPLFNIRTIAFGVTSACLIFIYNQAKIYKNEDNVYEYIGNLASYAWCVLLFYLIGVEITDTATKISAGNHRYLQLFVDGQAMFKTIGWMIYSVILAKLGTKKTMEPVIYFSIVGCAIAVLNLVANQYGYEQACILQPIFNLRFLAFVASAAGLIIVNKELQKSEDSYDWFKTLQGTFTYTWCMLLFVLIGLEISTSAVRLSYDSNTFSQLFVNGQGMIQAAGWMIYSATLLSIGFKKNIKEIIYFSLAGMGITIAYLFIQQASFANKEDFLPILNLRCLAFVITTAGLIFANKLFKQNAKTYTWCENLPNKISYLYGVILFLLVNFEINDYFNQYGYSLNNTENIKPLITSCGWLIYSMFGIYFGIVKKVKPLRYLSLFVLAMTIIKVFIFDLSFLDSLGRIISFMGLGTILLLLSFVYQKYSTQIKKLINEDIKV